MALRYRAARAEIDSRGSVHAAFGWLALLLIVVLGACSAPPTAAPPRREIIEGRVVERIDSPPYSFLRVAAADGELWVGVSVADHPNDSVVRLKDCVLVRNHLVRSAGRRLDEVYFGTLDRH